MREHKVVLGLVFKEALKFFADSLYDDVRKTNALDTLVVFLHSVLRKEFAGWELMELLAGTVSESDRVFGLLVESIEKVLESGDAPVALKHRTLQLALVFACGVGQLSPGAYLLRRDLFPTIVMFIKTPETTPFTFEAVLLLSVLLNYHKSDAANLNPYLKRVRGSVDHTLLSKVSWALGYAFETSVKRYQEIQDDTPPTLVSTVGSFLTALRPDRALSSTPVETPKELFKDQPIEAAAALLPLYELFNLNPVFSSIVVESLSTETTSTRPPMICSFISLASYLFSHASSAGTTRCLAYANLTMRVFALMSQEESMVTKLARESGKVRICRQRLPRLPETPASRPILNAMLDACILWLRHNLHKKMEVSTYRFCISTLQNIFWALSRQRIRLDYHWEELWRSIVAVLDFVASRLENVRVLGRVDELIQETLITLEGATIVSEALMPTPEALHQFVYEIVRSKPTIDKQMDCLTSLEAPMPSATEKSRGGAPSIAAQALHAITTIQGMSTYYETKINEAGSSMEIGDVMKVIAAEVERDGIRIDSSQSLDPPTRRTDPTAEANFVKWACNDGLALLS